MAFELAPWLRPPDFLQAIQNGAQLGLGVRRADLEQAAQAQQAQEAAARLQQSWAEKMLANQANQQRNQIAAQGVMDERIQRNNALEDTQNWRMGDLWLKQQKLNQPPEDSFSSAEGLGIFNRRTGEIVTPSPAKPVVQKEPSALTPSESKEYGDLMNMRQVVTPGSVFPILSGGTPATTNYSSAGLSPYNATRFAELEDKKNAYVARHSPVPLQTNSVTPSPAAGTLTGRVRVIGPDGRMGTVSAANFDEALRNGYKPAD